MLLSIAGIAVFAYLVGARYGTPFVVAQKLLIGGAVFAIGRFLIVILHELAHGMALAHYKRRTTRAGIFLPNSSLSATSLSTTKASARWC